MSIIKNKKALFEAKEAYGRYAIQFNKFHQFLSLTIMLVSFLAVIIRPGVIGDYTSTSLPVVHGLNVAMVAIVAGIQSAANLLRFNELATDCQIIATHLNLYLSGLITEQAKLDAMREQIVTRILAVKLIWFEVPSLTNMEWQKENPLILNTAVPMSEAHMP